MLEGKMYMYGWGTREELVETYRFFKELYPEMEFTGEVFAREGTFGVREDKSIAPNCWLFEVKNEAE